MAGISIPDKLDIDYRGSDGHITYLKTDQVVLVDASRHVAADGWRAALLAVVQAYGLDRDDGPGLHAFVPPLLADQERICP